LPVAWTGDTSIGALEACACSGPLDRGAAVLGTTPRRRNARNSIVAEWNNGRVPLDAAGGGDGRGGGAGDGGTAASTRRRSRLARHLPNATPRWRMALVLTGSPSATRCRSSCSSCWFD